MGAVTSIVEHKVLRNGVAEKIDGIYIDGLYTLNMPQSYILLRKLRRIPGDDRIIYLHSTPRPGNDGYLLQIDTYSSYGSFGENRISASTDDRFFRYFQGTYNISNTVSVMLPAILYATSEPADQPII